MPDSVDLRGLSSTFAKLLDGFTQETRLLRLSTPMGGDVLLAECVRGEEAISRGFRFQLSALSTDAGLSLRALLGQPVLLELLTATSGNALRPFHAHVTAIRLEGSNGGMARYALTLEPWTAFLARSRDSRVFQDMTVFDILDAVFARYQGQGKLAPAWRFDIRDRTIYPRRSLSTQYQESDLAFAERLMSEEGLFYFFNHEGEPDSPSLGRHELLIADHNGAFQPNAQNTVRFTQPGAVMKEDSMDRWRSELRLQTNAVELRSWDYRTLDSRPVSASAPRSDGANLLSRDAPGAYAYATREQGQRIAEHQLQALEARKQVFTGAGTVRTLAPGTTFTLDSHAVFDLAASADARSFLITRTVHLMHNNLSAELQAGLMQRIGGGLLAEAIAAEHGASLHAVGKQMGERPLYRNRIDAISAALPYRASSTDGHGQLLHPRPTVTGQQTAIVVGPSGAVVHTDRDHRVKVQFHWQRGEQSHSRLSHPAPDGHSGAPADDKAGTWVRIAAPLAPVAGANWGSHAVPRIGQEVLIDFLEGNIDRPVIIGAVYNGKGQTDAQHNQMSQGAGVATGNAPAWFPGEAGAHAHPAVLSGIKSQSMDSSQAGGGAYGQLVFDDSPGQSRVALQRHAKAHQGSAELNLGHLRHQTDNQRLAPVGFGAELKTEHSAALRAGQGMLLSADKRTGASGAMLDSREAQAQIKQSQQLQTTLASTAQKHNAKLKDEKGAEEPQPEVLPAIAQMAHSADVLEQTSDVAGEDGKGGDNGGRGSSTAYGEAHLQLSSPAGMAMLTPASAILSGSTGSISAGQDINLAAQANMFHTVRNGISLFTYGKATNKEKPNQETGIRLHAASGKVSSQSQSDLTRLTADKSITVASVTKSVTVAAKNHVLLTAQGASIKLEGGNIVLSGPGKIEFKASKKELGGPASASPTLPALPKTENIDQAIELNFHYGDLEPVLNAPYKVTFADGTSRSGKLDAKGHARIENVPPGEYHVEYGEDTREWTAPPLEPDPHLEQARQQKDQAAALLEAARKNSETGGVA
ncbi:type VI secretion system tip protein VgrG [Oxalobacteraceae bacterium]|nr:type VI secretion system tip protein VgrG [Oxalobacteraceae bacterium]